MGALLLAGYTLLLIGCDNSVSPPFLNYQDCQVKKSRQYQKKGASEFKATLEARAECRKLYNR